jgi:hypothetical protein
MNTTGMREIADRLLSYTTKHNALLEAVGVLLRSNAREIDSNKERLAAAETLVALCIDGQAGLMEIRVRAREYSARYLLDGSAPQR